MMWWLKYMNHHQTWYSAIPIWRSKFFTQILTKRHPIAHPWGRGMWCLLWVQLLIKQAGKLKFFGTHPNWVVSYIYYTKFHSPRPIFHSPVQIFTRIVPAVLYTIHCFIRPHYNGTWLYIELLWLYSVAPQERLSSFSYNWRYNYTAAVNEVNCYDHHNSIMPDRQEELLLGMYCSGLLPRHTLFGSHIQSLIARFMGLTWGPSGADRTQVGPMLAPWTLLSGLVLRIPHTAHFLWFDIMPCPSWLIRFQCQWSNPTTYWDIYIIDLRRPIDMSFMVT